MNKIFRSAVLFLSVLIAGAASLHAASTGGSKSTTIVDIAGGYLDFSLDSGFTSSLQGQGIIFSYHGTATDRGNRAFRLETGTVDTTTGAGEFLAVGNVSFTEGNTAIYLYRMELDSTGNAPVITALLAINNKVIGRIPVFTVVITSQAFTAQLLMGNTISSMVSFTVTSGFAAQFNTVFNAKAITYGETAGTVGINVLLP